MIDYLIPKYHMNEQDNLSLVHAQESSIFTSTLGLTKIYETHT